jgi:bis(5'-nucleosyl)-tetraphosphatase (symmetrical)
MLWAIGDVHGCYRTLRKLLQAIRFDAGRDRLWLVGDLVGRGPRALDVLRFLSDNPAATAVLGNHDLFLLACAAGVARPRAKDRLTEVLAAYDRDELLGWLARRPLLVRQGDTLLLHAGLLPSWTPDRAERRARRAEERLAGPGGDRLLAAWRGDDAVTRAVERDAETLDILCRLRACTAKGEPYRGFTGAPSELPRRCRPWFDMPGRASAHLQIVCGHWAALGLMVRPDVLALDTGCVWKRALTAVRLEDRRVVQQDYADD